MSLSMLLTSALLTLIHPSRPYRLPLHSVSQQYRLGTYIQLYRFISIPAALSKPIRIINRCVQTDPPLNLALPNRLIDGH